MNKRKSVEIRSCKNKVQLQHRRSHSSCNLQQLLNADIHQPVLQHKPQPKQVRKKWKSNEQNQMKVTQVDCLEWNEKDLQKTQLNLKAFLGHRIFPISSNQQELLLYKLQLLRNKELILNTIRETSEKDFSVASVSIEDFRIANAEFDFLNDSQTKKNFCKKKSSQLKKETVQEDNCTNKTSMDQNQDCMKKRNIKIDEKKTSQNINTYSPVEQRKITNSKKINFPQISVQDFSKNKSQKKQKQLICLNQQSKITETTQEFSDGNNYDKNSLLSLMQNKNKINSKLSIGRKIKTLQNLGNSDFKLKTFSIKNLLKQTQDREFFLKNFKKQNKNKKQPQIQLNHKFCKNQIKKNCSQKQKNKSTSKKRHKKTVNYSQKLKRVKEYSNNKTTNKSVQKKPKVFQKSSCLQRILEIKKQWVYQDLNFKLKAAKF